MENISTVLTEPDIGSKVGGPPQLTNLSKSVIGVTFSIVIIWGIIGNTSVCYIIVKDLKLSVTNLFLLNLSLADILMGIFCGPFVMLNDFILGYWPFGSVLCKLMPAAQGVSCFVSALTHIVISIDRFIAVYYPLKQRIRQRSAVYILLAIWVLAATIMSPLPFVYQVKLVGNRSYCQESWHIFIRGNYSAEQITDMANLQNMIFTIFLLISQYFLPLVVIVSTYSAIAFRVWIQRTPGEVDEKRDQRIAKSKRKLLKMVILVAILYGLSKLPRHVFFLASLQNSTMWISEYSIYFLYIWVFCVLADLSSIGHNPLIYGWMNKLFRSGFVRIWFFFMPCCAQNSRFKCSTKDNSNAYSMSYNYERTAASKSAACPLSHKTHDANDETEIDL